jgi:hypothetical protein
MGSEVPGLSLRYPVLYIENLAICPQSLNKVHIARITLMMLAFRDDRSILYIAKSIMHTETSSLSPVWILLTLCREYTKILALTLQLSRLMSVASTCRTLPEAFPIRVSTSDSNAWNTASFGLRRIFKRLRSQ